MSGRLPPPFFTALDANGNPYAGAKLYFYVTGTSTPKDTYSDAALSTPNANPVVADAGGVFGSIFMSNEAYKVVLKTSADVTVWTADPVRGPFSSGDVSIAGYALLASTNTFTATQTVQLTDNGATAGPEIILDRNSASPAASDRIGNALFRGRDSGGNNETYAEVQAAIIDPTAASEDGALVARTVIAGTLADRVLIGAGLYTSGVTGGDPGAGKINATEIQVNGTSLKVVQVQRTQDAAVATGTTTIPLDDTVPQNTEGDQYITVAITPKNASSVLVIEANLMVSPSANVHVIGALFKDSDAAALAACAIFPGASGAADMLKLKHTMTAGGTSAITFKVRLGLSSAGTLTFNGASSARLFGAVAASTLTVTEVLP